jgi:hypothetical protein
LLLGDLKSLVSQFGDFGLLQSHTECLFMVKKRATWMITLQVVREQPSRKKDIGGVHCLFDRV